MQEYYSTRDAAASKAVSHLTPEVAVGGFKDSLCPPQPFPAAESCQPSQDHNQQKRPLILPGPKEVSFRKRKGRELWDQVSILQIWQNIKQRIWGLFMGFVGRD